jgi:hypothetical protein
MTVSTDVKHLFHILMIVFSLFVLAAPIVNASTFENCSKKSADTQDKELEENPEDNLEEKSETTIFFNTSFIYVFSTFLATRPSYKLYLYTYKNNYSLDKPPISHS